MPELTKIFLCAEKEAPQDKVIYILQDSDGWFWLKKRVEEEGFTTPFTSIEELENFLELKLEIRKTIKFDELFKTLAKTDKTETTK